MSWKGFTKAINRIPARATNRGTGSDDEYNLLAKRMVKLQIEANTFYNKARKVKDSLNAMLAYQSSLGKFFHEVLQPLTEADDSLNSTESIATSEIVSAFLDKTAALKETLHADMDFLEREVITPIYEYTKLIANAMRLMEKRDRKRIDFERHTATVQKIRNNTSRSVNDEKRMAQVSDELEVATRDYNDLNNTLKAELPQFLQLKDDLIGSCFLTLYNYQLRYYKQTSDMYNDLIHQASAVFGPNQDPNLDFQPKYAHMIQTLEQIKFQFKSPGGGLDSQSAAVGGGAYQSSSPYANATGAVSGASAGSSYANVPVTSKADEAYGQQPEAGNGSSEPLPSYSSGVPGDAGYCIALFDYEAQDTGDLSFHKGDRIEILERAADVNDWWRGRLNGVEGVFPGNFVQEL